MKKRAISLILTLCLIMGMVPSTVFAAEVVASGTCGENLTWVLDDSGLLKISGTGEMNNYLDYCAEWYDYREQIVSIIIEDGVASIGNRAFYYCRNLTSATIPDSVTSIGDNAFYDCNSMTSVTIPDSVTNIGNRAFCGCNSMTSVTIPDSVTSIGENAFAYCDSLTSAIIGDGIATIPDDLLRSCSNLRELSIGSSVSSIGENVLLDCSSLTEIWVDENNTYYSSDDFGVLYDKEKTTLFFVPNALSGEYSVSNKTTTIGEGAFLDNKMLTSVMIPASVTSIGDGAFRNCESLTGICVDENNAYYSSDNSGVLFDKNKSLLISAPGAISGAYVVPKGVTTIGDAAFKQCDWLTSVTIPNSVTSIGDSTFYGCSRLTDVTLSQSITEIGWWTFAYAGITSIVIPENVSYIDRCAFFRCYDLTEIVFEWGPPYFCCLDYDCSNVGAFVDVVATVYYPANNPFWTYDMKQDFGGTLSWVSYNQEVDDDSAIITLEGAGTKDDPYQILSTDQFAEIQKDMDAHYILTEDLDFSGYGEWEPLGSPAKPFTGSIDGNGKSITNISVGSKVIAAVQYTALFAAASGAEFKNMTIEGLSINFSGESTYTKTFAGALVACNSSSEIIINNCKIDRTVSITTSSHSDDTLVYVGGLVGYTNTISIDDSQVSGDVNCLMAETYERSSAYVGGCVGYASGGVKITNLTISGNIDYCISQGTVYGYTGGVAGYCGGTSSIQDLTYTGDVNSEVAHSSIVILEDSPSYLYTGGLFGEAGSYSIFKGSVDGDVLALLGYGTYRTVGGLIGVGGDGTIYDSSFSGTIRGTAVYDRSKAYAGGFVGVSGEVTISTSSVTGQITNRGYYRGNIYTGGMIGYSTKNITIVSCQNNCTLVSAAYDGADPTIYEGKWVGYSNSLTVKDQDEEDGNSSGSNVSVRYFACWDSESQIAYFDSDPTENPANLGSQVTEETDTSFLKNVDLLVGHYVLVEAKTRDDGMIAPDTLISIIPVETYAGTITEIGELSISIDGVSYPVAERLYPLFFSVGDLVMYHLYDGEIIGINEYDGESPLPENPVIPEPVYELVLTPNVESMSIEVGQTLEITCELYCDAVRVEEWEQPQLSISHTESADPLTNAVWEALWTGNYKLTLDAATPGIASVTISDATSGTAKTIEVEVLSIATEEFDDPSKAEWVSQHIKYAKSDEYKEQVVNGFSGTLNTAFEEIRDDWTIGAYSTLDQVNKILDLDINGLSETQEYELLLVQILFSYNGVVSIEETYSNYLSESSIDLLRVLFLNEDFTAGIDDQTLADLNNQLNSLSELIEQNEDALREFQEGLENLLTDVDNLNVSMSDTCFDELQNVLGLFAGFALDEVDGYCKMTSECIMYLAAGEAYARTSDTFAQMLLEMRSHLNIPSDLDCVDLKEPLFSEETFLTVLDRETSLGNQVIASNPFDTPIRITELCRAIENIYTQMESYEKDGGITIAQEAVNSFRNDTAWNVFGTASDVVSEIFEKCPIVQAFKGIKALFDGTQFVIEKFTGIDERKNHGTMVMRLYCMSMVHYATVNTMAENTESWGMVPADGVNYLDPMLDRNAQYDAATIFDEAVAFYRAIRAVATEYAKAYYRTPIFEAPNQLPCGPFRTITEMEADLHKEQSMLDYEWCHEAYKGVILDPSSLITFGMKCPINITVLNEDNALIAELSGGTWTVTPGYEAYFTVTEFGDSTEEFFKTVTVPHTYTVSISGTNDGEMDAVALNDYSENAVYFFDVPITTNTIGTFSANSENTGVLAELKIDGITVAGETDVHVHEYDAPAFSWTEKYECTATFTCVEDDDSQTTYCMVTSETILATEADEGTIIYTATTKFAGQTYTDTKTVALPVLPVDSGTCGDNLTWKLTSAGTLTISGIGEMWDYAGTDAPWGECYQEITKLIVEDGVTSIGNYAFYCLYTLECVYLPDTVTRIGEYAFDSCIFTEVSLPISLTEIGNGAFSMCEIEAITIPYHVVSIGNYAFAYCSKLTDVWFTGNVPAIGGRFVFETYSQIHYPKDNETWSFAPDNGDYYAWNGMTLYWNSYVVNHTWGGGSVITEPSAESDGVVVYLCTSCGATYTEVTHQYVLSNMPPNCTEPGYSLYTCSVCGDSYTDSTTDALGHDFVDGKCSRCEEKDPDYKEPEVTGVTRIFGATRYDTAFKAADQLKENLGIEKFENIVVAYGEDFADALSGSYLANQKNAPILLVKNRNKEINLVKDYIKSNLTPGGTVYLLGGVNAVPKAMESGLEGFNVKRLAGATRYETNLEILKEAGISGNDILVCTGLDFADGLSASAVNKPILLVKDSLRATQVNYLKTLGTKNFYLIGGTNAVNKRIESALGAYGTTQRIEGATRYYTSVNIAKTFFPNAKTAVLAYAQNFPDGLSGGCLACSMNAPLILTANGKQAPAVAYAKEAGIAGGAVLGGTGLIPDKVANAIFQIS